jgi:hypothetical protein
LAGCGLVFVALVTMAFVTTATDEPLTSDVSAGGVDPAAGAAAFAMRTAATPIPTPEPTVEAETADAPAEGADEALADTDESGSAVDADAVVPEGFVPAFVSDDLTDTGTHTSATPQPAASAPPAAAPAAPAPDQPPVTEPSLPAVESVPAPTPTPVPATPEPEPEPDDDSDRPPRGDGDPSAADWAALRECESSGNYGIASGNGYFGAYQFSQATWDWVATMVRPDLVGVVPSDAAPGDQDALAFALYDMRGAAPWPTCGVHLR